MRHHLVSTPLPSWLRDIDSASFSQHFPLADVVADSVYYPASGFDGMPVRYLGNAIHSFIYAEYGHSEDRLIQELATNGFRGYRPILERSVRLEELLPPGKSLGDLQRGALTELRTGQSRHPSRGSVTATPFARWFIFEREPTASPDHGPERFSLLFLAGDGVSSYYALYNANRLRPRALAIIQPGAGFGGNWTHFDDPNADLARVVEANPAGSPEYLLAGGNNTAANTGGTACWPVYDTFCEWLVNGHERTVGLFRRSSAA